MSQPKKISSQFDDQIDQVVNKIKEEPAVEFVLILPPQEVKEENFSDSSEDQKQSEEKKFHCQQCLKLFEIKKNLLRHKEIYKPKVKCQICSKEVTKKYLKIHLKSHENIKDFKCDLCSAGFVTKNRLVLHMWMHRGEKRFKCSECNRGFNIGRDLKIHLLSHSVNPRPFQCDQCPKTYSRKQILEQHLLEVHLNDVLRCVKCDFTTKRKNSLLVHKKVHSTTKPFLCQICDKKFKTKAQVQRHQVVHKTEKDVECKTCGQMFVNRQNMLKHEKVVHGKKKFYFQRNTEIYILFSGLTKTFICIQCSRTFLTKNHLNQHVASHLNDGMMNCPVCSKKFKKRNLKKHYKRSKCGKTLDYCKTVKNPKNIF